MQTLRSIVLYLLLFSLSEQVLAQRSAFQRGNQAFQEDNYSLAVSLYSQHILEYPNDPRPYYWRGMANWHLEQLPNAVRDLKRAIERNLPDPSEAYYWKGMAELRLASYSAAIGSLTQALNHKYEAKAYIYKARGDAYFALDEHLHAIEDFEQAIRHDHPETGLLNHQIGKAYDILHDNERALHHYKTSVSAKGCPDPLSTNRRIKELESELKTVAGEFLWLEPLTAISEVRERQFRIEACLSTNRRLLERIEIEINGRVAYQLRPEELPYSSAPGCERNFSKMISLQKGENRLVLRAILHQGEVISEERIVQCNPVVPIGDRPKVWAMIVGVASYTHARSLRFSDDDAYRIYAFLRSPEGGAVPEEQISLLIDEDATRANIIRRLEDLFAKAGRDDLVIMYFSGHGLPGSFVPYDYNGEKNTLLAHHEIQRVFRQTRARNRLCIADACHSGSLDKGARTLSISEITDRYYDELRSSEGGMALLMSSKAEENSIEYRGLRQGVFSHYLINGLKGEADADQDGVVRIGELYQFVKHKTKSYTLNRQNPELHGLYDRRMPVGVVR